MSNQCISPNKYDDGTPHPGGCKKNTATSIHGRCLACGFQKFPSTVLEARAAKRR